MPGPKSDEGKSGGSGFTVSDRRIFSDEAADPRADSPAGDAGVPEGSTGPAAEVPSTRELPAVDFHTFILSLGSSALLHLGELEHPDGGPARADLPLAKHTIDIIAMLQDKTRGNLTPPEERLMESLLYDLRLRFVERSKT